MQGRKDFFKTTWLAGAIRPAPSIQTARSTFFIRQRRTRIRIAMIEWPINRLLLQPAGIDKRSSIYEPELKLHYS